MAFFSLLFSFLDMGDGSVEPHPLIRRGESAVKMRGSEVVRLCAIPTLYNRRHCEVCIFYILALISPIYDFVQMWPLRCNLSRRSTRVPITAIALNQPAHLGANRLHLAGHGESSQPPLTPRRSCIVAMIELRSVSSSPTLGGPFQPRLPEAATRDPLSS